MSRRRQKTNPWIQRWSRVLIAGIAVIGALGTAYLTVVKLTGGDAACPTEGCDRVLTSPYAELFGIPLTIFGCLAYTGMAVMAAGPLAVNPDRNKELRQKLEQWTKLLMFIGAVGLVVFSGYLMYLLAFEIRAACIYCLTSAAMTVTMLGLVLAGQEWDDPGQLWFTGAIVAVVATTGSVVIYAQTNPNFATTTAADVPGQAIPAVTTTSGAAETELARWLDQSGAVMYGAWWCSHCHNQKQLFGRQAAAEVPYVECDSDGQNPQVEVCRAAGVTGFPTWEVNGEMYAGTQSLETLATLSGYEGSREFQN